MAGYFAIITADVRYDTRLSANEKLLFGEIEALTQQEGYAWASNSYFAELYGVSRYTISRWLSKLQRLGYITADVDRAAGNRRKIIVNRNAQEGLPEEVSPVDENRNSYCGKAQDLLTESARPVAEKRNPYKCINNITNNKKEYRSPAMGEFENVYLTADEKDRLVQRLGKDRTEGYIERLSGWLAEGHTKKNHYATILNWWRKDGGQAVQPDAPAEVVTVPTKPRTAEDIKNLSVEELLSSGG